MFVIFKRLIELGRTDGLEKRIDTMYALGKLTDDEYDELINMLKK